MKRLKAFMWNATELMFLITCCTVLVAVLIRAMEDLLVGGCQ